MMSSLQCIYSIQYIVLLLLLLLTIQYNTTKYNTIRCDAMRCDAMQCISVQCMKGGISEYVTMLTMKTCMDYLP